MMRRALIRTSKTSPSLILRPSIPKPASPPRFLAPVRHQQHAVANPTLASIEKRWEAMPPQEQAELWMKLRDRMKKPWSDMTMQEKKAAYWIAFGPHGPRAEVPPEEKWWIMRVSIALCAVGAVIMYIIRSFARPAPRTMTKEWQEATNEYLKSQNVEPISGISSEGYTGTYVQSKPAKSGGGMAAPE